MKIHVLPSFIRFSDTINYFAEFHLELLQQNLAMTSMKQYANVSAHDVASMSFEQRLSLAGTGSITMDTDPFGDNTESILRPPKEPQPKQQQRNGTIKGTTGVGNDISRMSFAERVALIQAKSPPLEYAAEEFQTESGVVENGGGANNVHTEFDIEQTQQYKHFEPPEVLERDDGIPVNIWSMYKDKKYRDYF